MYLSVDHGARIGQRVKHKRFARNIQNALIRLKPDQLTVKAQNAAMLFHEAFV